MSAQSIFLPHSVLRERHARHIGVDSRGLLVDLGRSLLLLIELCQSLYIQVGLGLLDEFELQLLRVYWGAESLLGSRFRSLPPLSLGLLFACDF